MKDTVSYLAETSQTYLDEHDHTSTSAAPLALHETVAVAIVAATTTCAVATAAGYALAVANVEPIRAERTAREAATLAVVALDATATKTVVALLHVLGVRDGNARGVLSEHRGGVDGNLPRLRRNAIVVAIQLE